MHMGSGILRPLKRLGNYQGDELAIVIDILILERRPAFARPALLYKRTRRTIEMRAIAVMENRQYPRHLFRLSAVEAHDAAFPNGAGNANAIRHMPYRMLHSIRSAPCHLQSAVN